MSVLHHVADRGWRYGVCLGLFFGVMMTSAWGWSQDRGRDSVDIFLDEEKVDVEADIPSVDLFLTFRGLHYESLESKKSFLPELFRTVETEPF